MPIYCQFPGALLLVAEIHYGADGSIVSISHRLSMVPDVRYFGTR